MADTSKLHISDAPGAVTTLHMIYSPMAQDWFMTRFDDYVIRAIESGLFPQWKKEALEEIEKIEEETAHGHGSGYHHHTKYEELHMRQILGILVLFTGGSLLSFAVFTMESSSAACQSRLNRDSPVEIIGSHGAIIHCYPRTTGSPQFHTPLMNAAPPPPAQVQYYDWKLDTSTPRRHSSVSNWHTIG